MRRFVTVVAMLAISSAVAAPSAADLQACQGDVGTYCGGVKSGGGRIIACLGKHKEELSQACLKVLQPHKPAPAQGSNPDHPGQVLQPDGTYAPAPANPQ